MIFGVTLIISGAFYSAFIVVYMCDYITFGDIVKATNSSFLCYFKGCESKKVTFYPNYKSNCAFCCMNIFGVELIVSHPKCLNGRLPFQAQKFKSNSFFLLY